MSFLAPLMLLGALALAIPVALHLFGRQRAKVVRFAAMDFLLGTQRKTARKLAARERILLALRVLACLVLAAALAKPMTSCGAKPSLVTRGPQAVAIVIDDSLASHTTIAGDTLLLHATKRARRLIDELGPEAEVSIVRAAAGAPAPGELSRDHLRLGRELAALRPSLRPADLTAALRRAQALLATSSHVEQRVFVIAPQVEALFPGGEAPWPEGQGPELTVLDPSEGASLANLAIIAAFAQPAPELGARTVKVTATVENLGAVAVTDRPLSLRLGERVVARVLVSLAPGARTVRELVLPLPGDARSADLTLELEHDALPDDDRRFVRAELRDRVRVLVVDGDPRTARHDDEVFYLETALAPGARAASGLELKKVTPDELASVALADLDVIMLCNVRALEPGRAEALAAWVKAGGGLFMSMGDQVDVDAWNQAEPGRPTMRPILPLALQAARTLAPPNATAKERDDLAEHLASKLELSHPILAVFDAEALRGLRAARFHRVMLTASPVVGTDRRVLARFGSGAPALVEARLGKGRLLFFASSIDRDWTDLPIVPAFLPLVQQAARYLGRAPMAEQPADLLVGARVELPVDTDDVRLEVIGPDGRRQVFDRERVRGRATVEVTDTAEPGAYRVAAQREGGQLRPRASADFVVNVDARGGDLRRVGPDRLPHGGVAAVATSGTTKAPVRQVALWHALAAALLGLLVLEGVLGRREGLRLISRN